MASIAFATAVRYWLNPLLGPDLPYLTYIIAVMCAAWYAGAGPAAAAMAAGMFAADYCFVPPLHTFGLRGAAAHFELATYIFVGAVSMVLSEAQHRARRQAEDALDQLLGEVARRQRAQTAEYRQREWAQAVLSAVADAVLATDGKGCVTSINPAAADLTGWSAAEALGRPLAEVFRLLDKTTREPLPDPARAAGALLVHRGGAEAPVEISAADLRNESGGVSGTVFAFRDVSQRIRAEQAERLMVSIVESSQDSIIVTDLNDTITLWNRGAERLYGYSAEEALGQPHSMLSATDTRLEVAAALERFRRGETLGHFEARRRTRDGRDLLVSVMLSPVLSPEGGLVAVSRVARDITEEKRAQNELARAHQRLNSVLGSIGDAFVAVDPEWRVTYANAEAARFRRKRAEEFLGRTVWEEWTDIAGTEIERQLRLAMNAHAAVHFETFYAPRNVWIDMHAYPFEGGLSVFYRDITVRKRTQEQLREALQKLRFHVENTPLAVVEWDAEFHISAWSDEAERVFGWSAAEVLGRHINELPWVYEEDVPKVDGVMRDMLSGRRPRNLSANRNRRKDGTVIHCEWYNSALLDPAGKMISVFSLVLDVTARHEAEEALRRSEERYRQLAAAAEMDRSQLATVLDSMGEALLIFDPRGRVRTVNRAGLELFGFRSREEFPAGIAEIAERYETRHGDGPLLPPEQRPIMRSLRGETVANFEMEVIERNTGRSWVGSFSSVPIRGAAGELIAAVATIHDLTERKMAEQALARSEERLELAQRAGAIGVLDWDLRTGDTVWTEQLELLLGLSVRPCLRRLDDLLERVVAEDAARIRTAVKEVLRRKQRELGGEFRVNWPEGLPHWLNAKARFFYNASGEPQRMVAVVMDVTERRRTEEKLRHAAKLESLGILAGGIAHDFNNLLVAMMGNASLVLDEVAPDSRACRYAANMLDATERAAQLTRQMLAYSGKGRFVDPERGPFGAGERHDRAASNPRSGAGTRRCAWNSKRGLPPVEADAGQLQQVIMNLVINAAEAIGRAGGEVIVRTGPAATWTRSWLAGAIAEDACAPGRYVLLEVRDTGQGMDAKPRWRASSTRSSPPSSPAAAWGWRRCWASCAAIGAPSGWRARRGGARRFRCCCPPRKGPCPGPPRPPAICAAAPACWWWTTKRWSGRPPNPRWSAMATGC